MGHVVLPPPPHIHSMAMLIEAQEPELWRCWYCGNVYEELPGTGCPACGGYRFERTEE